MNPFIPSQQDLIQHASDDVIWRSLNEIRDRLELLRQPGVTSRISPAYNDAMFPLPEVNAAPVANAAISTVRLTPNQTAAVMQGVENRGITPIRALAGSGKTLVLEHIARERGDRGIYLAYNKAIADAGVSRFPRTLNSRTIHAIALEAMSKLIKSAKKNIGDPTGRQIVEHLGLKSADRYRLATFIRETVERFANTLDAEFNATHLPSKRVIGQFNDDRVLQYADTIWKAMFSPGAQLNLSHDAYLKRWMQLGAEIKADYILFDEAQDATPVSLAVAYAQTADLILVGDRHQAIYAYKGTIDALSGAQGALLRETFRFGAELAAPANAVLALKGTGDQIVPMGNAPGQVLGYRADMEAYLRDRTVTYISRTNSELLEIAIERSRKQRVHIAGGLDKIARNATSAYALWSGALQRVSDPAMKDFRTWTEYEQWADQTKDLEGRRLVEMIRRHGAELPGLIANLATLSYPEQDASLILRTAHSCKGLEFDHVWLGDDFRPVSPMAKDQTADNEAEINILYVAATRARRSMRINHVLERLMTPTA